MQFLNPKPRMDLKREEISDFPLQVSTMYDPFRALALKKTEANSLNV